MGEEQKEEKKKQEEIEKVGSFPNELEMNQDSRTRQESEMVYRLSGEPV